MKRFIAQETFEHEGKEYAQGAIYDVTDDIEYLMPLWIGDGKVRDPDMPDDKDDDDDLDETIEEMKAKHEDDDDDDDDKDDA